MTKTSVQHIDYTFRESRQAKRVILKVSGQNGLEVVVPKGYDTRRLPKILQANQAWIEKHLQRTNQARALSAPEHIDLNAINERWRVQYRLESGGRCLVEETASHLLLIQANVDDVCGIASALNRWLHVKAQAWLVPWLREISREVDIPFNKATVRGQTTRWASCSRLGNISLNRSLLFLPEHLVRHVFLHELCHIKQLDHSPVFWQLLEDIDPEYKRVEGEVRKANQHLPTWVGGNKRR